MLYWMAAPSPIDARSSRSAISASAWAKPTPLDAAATSESTQRLATVKRLLAAGADPASGYLRLGACLHGDLNCSIWRFRSTPPNESTLRAMAVCILLPGRDMRTWLNSWCAMATIRAPPTQPVGCHWTECSHATNTARHSPCKRPAPRPLCRLALSTSCTAMTTIPSAYRCNSGCSDNPR
ncbi:MAG: hypothetical protein ACI9DC_003659 [Gammaproteobacteria bacterium]|jgi:hypothetical protein